MLERKNQRVAGLNNSASTHWIKLASRHLGGFKNEYIQHEFDSTCTVSAARYFKAKT